MYNDPNTMNQSGINLPITPGTDVFDVNGDKVGSVEQYNPQANCIVVEKGFLFTKELYIPVSDVTRAASDGIYLDLSKDDLKDDRFKSPPGGLTDRDRGLDLNP